MELSDSMKAYILETAKTLKGSTLRLFMARTVRMLGRGGQRRAERELGWNRATLRKGMHELQSGITCLDACCLRGRKPTETVQVGIEAALERVLEDEMAGDPMTEHTWVRSSLSQLSRQLKEQGFDVSASTVHRLLRKIGCSMRGNINTEKGFRANCPDRDQQFQYIASQKAAFATAGLPIISVDTKKKELIGNFRRNGKAWCKQAEQVNEHDFPSLAVCRAVPYGIYDVTKNGGYVYVGTSADTPEFAVDAIARWWRDEGCYEYPLAEQLLIMADGGGCNGCRSRAWKYQLQQELCDELGLTVTVCHYPTGCSKWNPIEHRLFSFISKNWAGKPLRTLATMLGFIRGTRTTAGLTVKAFLQEGVYQREQRVRKADMEQLALQPHVTCPNWNYTISPRFPNADGTGRE